MSLSPKLVLIQLKLLINLQPYWKAGILTYISKTYRRKAIAFMSFNNGYRCLFYSGVVVLYFQPRCFRATWLSGLFYFPVVVPDFQPRCFRATWLSGLFLFGVEVLHVDRTLYNGMADIPETDEEFYTRYCAWCQ